MVDIFTLYFVSAHWKTCPKTPHFVCYFKEKVQTLDYENLSPLEEGGEKRR